MFEPVVLGKTGLSIGRIGVCSSYGIDAKSTEKAFDLGCNYLYWGSLRRKAMGDGLRNVIKKDREKAVVVVQSFTRFPRLLAGSLQSALKKLGTDYADVLLLGWHNKLPSSSLLDAATELKRQGTVRFLALSTHNRKMVKEIDSLGIFDIFHFRYNAKHRGAEQDIFPHFDPQTGSGLVAFTATSWGQLLSNRKFPKDEKIPTAADCYRFALSNPSVHLVLSGPKNAQQAEAVHEAIEKGPMSSDEIDWMRRMGDYAYGRKR